MDGWNERKLQNSCLVFMCPRAPAVVFDLVAVQGSSPSQRAVKLSGLSSNSCITINSMLSLILHECVLHCLPA